MRLLKFLSISIILSSIPGAIFPVFFYYLFSWNTSATGRDILPALDNLLEIIGFIGMIIFSVPVFFIFVLLSGIESIIHAQGLIIPIYDSLPSNTQQNFFLAISIIINVFLWTIPVSFYMFVGKFVLTTIKSKKLENNSHVEETSELENAKN